MMIAIIVGTILISFFMWLQYSKLKCTKKINATYLKFNIYNHHGMLFGRYIPVFKYDFNGNEYENQAQQSFSKKSTKNFIVGEKYTILINEKNPKKFIINRKIKIDEILMLLMGLFLILSGTLYVLSCGSW